MIKCRWSDKNEEMVQRGTDHQILKEHEAGKRAAEIVWEYNISEQIFYRWKSKYGGMDVNEFWGQVTLDTLFAYVK